MLFWKYRENIKQPLGQAAHEASLLQWSISLFKFYEIISREDMVAIGDDKLISGLYILKTRNRFFDDVSKNKKSRHYSASFVKWRRHWKIQLHEAAWRVETYDPHSPNSNWPQNYSISNFKVIIITSTPTNPPPKLGFVTKINLFIFVFCLKPFNRSYIGILLMALCLNFFIYTVTVISSYDTFSKIKLPM